MLYRYAHISLPWACFALCSLHRIPPSARCIRKSLSPNNTDQSLLKSTLFTSPKALLWAKRGQREQFELACKQGWKTAHHPFPSDLNWKPIQEQALVWSILMHLWAEAWYMGSLNPASWASMGSFLIVNESKMLEQMDQSDGECSWQLLLSFVSPLWLPQVLL